MIKSEDGSYTAFSETFNEHYHSTKDGAFNETLYKHVLPAFSFCKDKQELHILDICFGLGFNTLTTIYYAKKHFPDMKLFIYSPEFDQELINSLKSFVYPKEFTPYLDILHILIETNSYQDESLHVNLFIGDAREYIKQFSSVFDIVYQDAFSPQNNPALWTKEYFHDIKSALKPDGILTTYSIALPVRLALHVNNFYIYLFHQEHTRDSTIASLKKLPNLAPIDMQHKINSNPNIFPLSDNDIF
ncbi:MAG: hypothetical protein GXO11_04730 [Epsilonproteobacteria bacterium]|nr:hypothetical protein [Campylobacterota bacterium]